LKGAGTPWDGFTPGVRRWYKEGIFIAKSPDGKIVSFYLERK